jgi:SSS family transporter
MVNHSIIKLCFLAAALAIAPASSAQSVLNWEAMPPLPQPLNYYALGSHHGVIIVAGGVKMDGDERGDYSDEVYVLLPGADDWKLAGMRLPEGRAYAAGESNENGLWILGGKNRDNVYDDFLLLRWADDRLWVDTPSPLQTKMPTPLHSMGSILVNGVVYLIGGNKTWDVDDVTNSFWSLDLRYNASKWQTHPEIPGTPRSFPVVTLFNSEITVLGGYHKDAPERSLTDVWTWKAGDARWIQENMEYNTASGAATISVPPGHLLALLGWDAETKTPIVDAVHFITKTSYELEPMPVNGLMGEVIPYEDGWFFTSADPGADGGTIIPRSFKITLNETTRSALTWPDYTTLVLYFATLVYIGFYFSKREKNTESFFLGGRNIPWWAVGISIFGTSLSAITYIAIPATAYASNWVNMLNNIGIVFLAPFIAAYYLPRLKELPYTTAYEFLEKRFNLGTRIYGSLVFIIFQIGRMSIVLYLPAIALSAATGISIQLSIVLMGILATAYTALGGIEAVIWTDVLQSVVLLFGAVLTLVLVVSNIDMEIGQLFTMAREADKFHTFNWTWDITTDAVWIAVVGGIFANAYVSMADQTVVQRYLSTSTPHEAKKALWFFAGSTIPMQLLFFGIGTALWIYYHQHPAASQPGLQNDAILPLFVIQQFPVGLKGVLIAGLFAASMSSLDSSMNSLSSVFVNDYYRRFLPGRPEKSYLQMAKGLTVFLGIFATASALYLAENTSVQLFSLFLQLLNLVGGGLAGIYVLGVCTQRANGIGALTGGIVSGIVMYFVRSSDIYFFAHAIFGFTSSVVVGYLVSLIFQGKKNTAPV